MFAKFAPLAPIAVTSGSSALYKGPTIMQGLVTGMLLISNANFGTRLFQENTKRSNSRDLQKNGNIFVTEGLTFGNENVNKLVTKQT